MSKAQGYSPFVKQCFVTAAVCLNVLTAACMTGYTAVLVPQLQQTGSSISLTLSQESWITGIMGIAMLLGNLVTPGVMDWLGRRPMHLLISATHIGGWAITALAADFPILLFSRIVLGIAFGMLLSLRSALIGEYTSPKNRGSFLALISLAQGLGIFMVHMLGTFFHWQTTAVMIMVFPFLSTIMTIYSPESPSFLAAKGRYEECKQAFRWLRGFEEEKELEDLIAARMETKKLEKMTLKDLVSHFKRKEFYKPILIMIHLNIMMQFCGGPLISAYSTTILTLLVGPGVNVYFWMLFLDVLRIVLNSVTVYIMDKFTRRTMLFSIGTLSVLTHIAVVVYVFLRDKGMVGDYSWIPLSLICVQVAAIAIALVPIPSVVAGEIFPLQYRGIGGAISITFMSLLTFLVLKTYPVLANNIGIGGAYAFYGCFLSYALTFNWFLLPETKGKTLQEIEDELRGRKLKPEEEEEMMALRQSSRKVSVWSMHSMTAEL